MTCTDCAEPCSPWTAEDGVVVHRCRLASWCPHLGLHLLSATLHVRQPRPRIASKAALLEIQRTTMEWWQGHSPADVWALRVPITEPAAE